MLTIHTSLSCRRLLLAVALASGAILSAAVPALAANPGPQYGSIGQYGEVWRGGGFDSCWFDKGAYDGQGLAGGVAGCASNETKPAAGKFVDPVGFTVDHTGSSDTLYVLDRTSDLPGNLTADGDTTTWRLQELGPTGQPLGSDTFSLPADTAAIEGSAADNGTPTDFEMYGLAVDPTLGRVYALLVGYNINAPSPNNQEIVYEILAWSTTPNGSGQLVPATGITSADAADLALGVGGDPTPAVLSNHKQLQLSAASPLPFAGQSIMESPTGIAIDVTGGNDNVAVQGADATANADNGGIVTVSPTAGTVVKNWSSASFAGIPNDAANEVFPGSGLATDPKNGNLVWLDDQESGTGTPANFDVAEIPASLPNTLPTTPPAILASLANAVTNSDDSTLALDDAAVSVADVGPEGFDDGTPIAATANSAPQIVALSNGLYAGVFEPEPTGMPDPSDPAGQPGAWTPTNPALRLLLPDSSGLLTEPDPPLMTLFDTLGNTTVNQSGSTSAASACNMSDSISAGAGANPYPSLAAGSNGAIWVLTNGQDSSGAGQQTSGTGPGAFQGGRQLIELAPNTGSACPTPSSTFTMSAGTLSQSASGPAMTVAQGTTVHFDASSIALNGAAPAAYTWQFGDGATSTNLDASSAPFTWPSTTASERYTALGTDTVTLTMFSDYGKYVETGTINVIAATPPTAAFGFSPASPETGQAVTFDASSSAPTPGASIQSYQWDFGDGRTQTTSSPTTTHTYSNPSAGYQVSLTILDSDGATSTAATHTVAVTQAAPPPPPVTTTTTTGGGGTPPPPSNAFSIKSLSGRGHKGSIVLQLGVPDPGTAAVRATFTAKVTVKGKHHKIKHVTKTFTFGAATTSVAGGTATLTVRPSGSALSALRALSTASSLSVSLHITFTPTGGIAASKNGGVKVTGLKVVKKHKKKK
jgi:PKD repeat protein